MEDLCDEPRKLIYKEILSQDLDTLTYKVTGNISRNYIKHAPPNCFLSQQILMKLMKH
jgi:hypothetical protein